MNFKIFQATQQEKKTDQSDKAHLKAKKIFFEQIQSAINNETIYDFIQETFEEYDTEKLCLLASFYEEYDFSKSRVDFFYVFDAICRNIYLLDDFHAKNIIQMIVETYYARHIYKIVKDDDMSLLRYLMTRLPATLLEETVLLNYAEIVDEIKYEDISFISTYASWRRKIPEYFENFMYLLDHTKFENFANFINMFPEYSSLVYEYILKCMLGEGNIAYIIDFGHGFDLVDDLLQPMADLEKYQGCYFSCIREYAVDILDYADTYPLMYEAGELLIEEFGISENLVNKIIDDTTDDYIHYMYECLSNNVTTAFQTSSDIFETLNDIFVSSKAYNRFMDTLPTLLTSCGIVLYSILLCLLGPVPELVNNQSLCSEYLETNK